MLPRHTQLIRHGEGEENGDCLRTAVACLFDLPAQAVPHFVARSRADHWFTDLTAWANRRGYQPVHLAWAEHLERALAGVYHIRCGGSPRHPGVYHAVVARGDTVIHDPHPEGVAPYLLPHSEAQPWEVLFFLPSAPIYIPVDYREDVA